MKSFVRPKQFLLVSCLVLAGISFPVHAEEKAPAPAPEQALDNIFKKFDLNKDGFVGDYEYTIGMRYKFDHMDRNNDGKVTREESKITGLESAFDKGDKDKDGVITEYDDMTNSRSEFKIVDQNADGYVTIDEFRTYVNKTYKNDTQPK